MTTLDYRNTAASEVHSHWLHRVALLTALCTFVLIFIGGLVTSKHAGMSVPDWPNSYGYNMFLFPPSKWVGGILFEHTHRLMGTVVGFCATVLTLMAWAPGKSAPGRHWIVRIFAGVSLLNAMGTGAMMIWPGAFRLAPPAGSPMNIFSQGAVTEAGLLLCAMVAYACRRREPRRWVRWIATACLIVVCIQGLLGGLRVDLINLTLAMVHGCFAQAAFCLIVLAWIVTGSWWQTAPELSRGEDSASGKTLIRLAMLSVAVVYGQLILGAVMRHLGAGLAIPDLPLAYGHLLPPTTANQLQQINLERVLHPDHFWAGRFDQQYLERTVTLDRVTFLQVWLHFAHRIGAIVVSLTLTSVILRIFLRNARRDLKIPAGILAALLVTQVALGLLTVYLGKPAEIASLHVAVGALVLATTFTIAVRAVRLYSLGGREAPMADFAETVEFESAVI